MFLNCIILDNAASIDAFFLLGKFYILFILFQNFNHCLNYVSLYSLVMLKNCRNKCNINVQLSYLAKKGFILKYILRRLSLPSNFGVIVIKFQGHSNESFQKIKNIYITILLLEQKLPSFSYME